MKITIGKAGLKKTWQIPFPETIMCWHCEGNARIAFVAHEHLTKGDTGPYVWGLHKNEGKGGYWLHDCCAVAVYFCCDCLEPAALYNQA